MIVAFAAFLDTVVDYQRIQRRFLIYCDHVCSMLQQHSQKILDYGEYFLSLGLVYNELGNLYRDQDKTKEAEDMYLHALMVMKKIWGCEHVSISETIGNLGILYLNQGKLQEAEDMYLQALVGFEKALGSEHLKMLKTINNLGVLYFEQGKMKEAGDMYERALKRDENPRCSGHLITSDAAQNLGILYFKQGKMEEAENMYLRAFRGYENTLGSERRYALDTRYALGLHYMAKSRFSNAVQMFELVVQGYIRLLGPEHDRTVDGHERTWKVHGGTEKRRKRRHESYACGLILYRHRTRSLPRFQRHLTSHGCSRKALSVAMGLLWQHLKHVFEESHTEHDLSMQREGS